MYGQNSKICLSLSLALTLTACGSEDPSFVTNSLGKYMVQVSDEPGTEGGYPVEALATEGDETEMDTFLDELSADAVDATAYAGEDSLDVGEKAKGSQADKETQSANSSNAASKGKGNSKATASTSSRADDDSTPTPPSPSPASSSSSTASSSQASAGGVSDGATDDPDAGSGGNTDPSQAKVAKACASKFQGQAQSIFVLDTRSANPNIQIGPNTVLAIHLSGNRQTVSLDLGASAGFAGLCLILTGHESQLTINSASSVGKLVYMGRGDQSVGMISMVNGASIAESSISLRGNQPQLSIQGAAAGLCGNADLKGNGPNVSCRP